MTSDILDLINGIAGQSGEGFILKLARASQHFETLEARIDAFLEGRPYLVVREAQPERTEFRAQIMSAVPGECALLVGDILQNARSSLDHLAWRLAGENADRHTGFPIYAKREEYGAQDGRGRPARSSGLLKVAGFPSEAQAIVESMQPYQRHELGGYLWGLNEYARIDRHRLLHLFGGTTSDVHIEAGVRNEHGALVMTNEGAAGTINLTLGAFEHDAVIGRFTHGPNVEVYCEFTFEIAMRDGEGGEQTYHPVLPTLAGALLAVKHVALELAPHLPKRAKPMFANVQPVKIDLGDRLILRQAANDQPYRARISHAKPRQPRFPPSKG